MVGHLLSIQIIGEDHAEDPHRWKRREMGKF